MVDEEHFFSVVIPTLNEQKLLPRLLKSLEKQIDRDFEVVVVDGASKDKTVEVAKKFAKRVPELKVEVVEKRNVGYQRNRGGELGKGKFLVFLDADVELPANFLSEVHHFLREGGRKCRFLTTWLAADSEDEKDKLLALFYSLYIEIAKAVEKPMVPGFCFVVERGVFKKSGGFDERASVGEDHELSLRLEKMGVEPQVLKSPRVRWSLRRFRREGTLKLLQTYAKMGLKVLTEGPVTQELFDYQMGGKIQGIKERKKKRGI